MNKYSAARIFSLFAFLITFSGHALSQQLNHTLQRDYSWDIDNHYNNKDSAPANHTLVKPYRINDLNEIKDSSDFFPRLLFNKKNDSAHAKKNESQFAIFPLLVSEAGYQLTSKSRFTNDLGVGVNLSANYKNKLALNFKFLACRQVFNGYMDSVVRETHVIPGIGFAYRDNDDSVLTRYSYQYYSGYISYSPNKIFNFQLGRDKHFWGDGYRSLFLSDIASPYPFFKITTNIWKLNYVNLFTIMKDATNPSGMVKDRLNKYATFHYLGWNITKRINVGLFESIVWQGSDSTRHRGYDINYLNPVIFFRPTEYSLGSSDNAFIGFSFKIKIFKKQQLYGQLLLDEFLLKEVLAQNGWWANKQAFQLGFKSFDLFKVRHLNFQTEFNFVRPYTYAHGSVQQNYAHLNQPLAHPLGANFMESASFINYRYKRLFIEAKGVYAIYGADSAGTDYGKNIFISYTNRASDYNNSTTQGLKTTLITASLRAAYIIDPSMNFKIELGLIDRIEHTATVTKQIPYIFFGIRTDLGNLYSDF